MNELEKQTAFEVYNGKTHRFGKFFLTAGLVMFLVAPFIMGFYLNAMPDIPAFAKALAQIAIIYIPSCVVEFLIYTPMLGAGGSYLAFITGNIMNLKLPCAVNALKLTGKQANTPEGDVVASIGVAASSIMTIIILTIAALLVNLISPVFELPAVKTMSNYLLPALFGSMTLGLFASTSAGSKVVVGGLKGVMPVIILVSLIALANRILNIMPGTTLMGMVGFLILAMLPVAIITSRILWKKGKIVVVDKEEA